MKAGLANRMPGCPGLPPFLVGPQKLSIFVSILSSPVLAVVWKAIRATKHKNNLSTPGKEWYPANCPRDKRPRTTAPCGHKPPGHQPPGQLPPVPILAIAPQSNAPRFFLRIFLQIQMNKLYINLCMYIHKVVKKNEADL